MPASTAGLMTVEEFRALPEDNDEFICELHHGELVQMTRPKLKHMMIQRTLRRLLETMAPADSLVEIEVAFRALPEYEYRVADVAWVCAERWAKADPDDNLHGAPDLVIEILSPSNTASAMYARETLCLEHGSREFWVVDADRKQVRVARNDGPARTYGLGQQIPLDLIHPGATLSVDQIFESTFKVK